MTSTPPPREQQPYGSPAQPPYGGPPPPQQPYAGPPPQQPYGGAPGYPPPPPLGAFDQSVGTIPVAAWLIPVAALLAVIGACTPWFDSSIVRNGQTLQQLGNLYSWRDGRIGLLPPIVLVLMSIGIVNLMRGKVSRRFSRGSAHPTVSAARGALIIGAVTFVFLAIAWAEVPSNYKFNGPYGEESTSSYLDRLSSASLSRGPQIGFYLTVVAGVLAIVAGVLMLVMRDRTAAGPAAFAPPGWSAPPPPSGYAPPSAPPAPAGYAPSSAPSAPSDGGWSSSTNYSPEQPANDGSDGRPNLTK